MSQLSFSVIIPLYNKEKYVERALASVLGQTYQNFEVLVINDGSTDRGPGIVDNIKDLRVKLISQSNSGAAVARNRGISLAKADIIAFLDADDEWKPYFLEMILKLRKKHLTAGIYATAYEIINHSSKIIKPVFCAIPSPPWEGLLENYFMVAAEGPPPITASSCCIPKYVIDNVGGFPEFKRMGEDLDLWGRIAMRYPVAFTSKIGAVYHQDADNRACRVFFSGDEHPFIMTVEKMQHEGKIPAHMLGDVYHYVCRLKVENMRQHVLAGNLKRARELTSEVQKKRFLFRRLLWGSRFNALTRYAWYYWYRKRNITAVE